MRRNKLHKGGGVGVTEAGGNSSASRERQRPESPRPGRFRLTGLFAMLALAALLSIAFRGHGDGTGTSSIASAEDPAPPPPDPPPQGSIEDIIQHVSNGSHVDVGYNVLDPGPHTLKMTLQASGGATAIDSSEVACSGTVIFTSSDNTTSAFEHHWTAQGAYAAEVHHSDFTAYTNDGAPGISTVSVSHLNAVLEPAGPDDDETEATPGVSMPITYNATEFPASFPLSDPTGRTLMVHIRSTGGGMFWFEGPGPQLAVYQQGETDWEKLDAGVPIPVGLGPSGFMFRVHTSNQFTGPVLLTFRLKHATTALDAADAINVTYDGTPPGPPQSSLNLAADSDNDNLDVQFRPPQYTPEEEDEEENPGMKMYLGEEWAKIEVNATDFDTGTLNITVNANDKFEFSADAVNVLPSTTLFAGSIDQSSFTMMTFYVRPKTGVAADGDQVTLTGNLTDSAGRQLQDVILFNAVSTIIDLDIFHGQYKPGANAVAEKYEQIPGAFTVANMNDTDGDGSADRDQPGVIGEKDLMRLILWRPKPYTAGANVTLEFPTAVGNGDVKIYLDSGKFFEIPLVDKKATFTFTLDPSDFRKEVWVELTEPSDWVGDFEIKWRYNTKEAVVNATAIWATKTGFKNQLTDTLWTDAGNPLKNTFNTVYGGKFGIQYAGGSIQVQYAMGMEFTIVPHTTGSDWNKWRVKFDVTRQKEKRSWTIDGTTVTQIDNEYWPGRPSFTSAGPTGSSIDYSNDDDPSLPPGSLNSDNDNTPENDHVYSIDGPGHDNDGGHSQYVRRLNFLEFVRVRFDGTTPSRTAGNDGTRCSPKAPWYAHMWSEKDGMVYKERAGKGSAVAEGYKAILPAPSP